MTGKGQVIVWVDALQQSEFIIAQKPESIEFLWQPPLLHCSAPVPMTENGHYTGWDAWMAAYDSFPVTGPTKVVFRTSWFPC